MPPASDPTESALSRFKANLNQSPPCRSYKQLLLITDFEAITEELAAADSPAGLVKVSKSWQVFKQAIKDLTTMGKSSATRLKSAITTAAKELDTQKKRQAQDQAIGTSAKAAKKSKSAPAANQNLADIAHAFCTETQTIAVCEFLSSSEVPLDVPVVLTFSPEVAELKDGTPMRNAAEAFGKKFANDPARNDPGRAQRACNAETIAQVDNMLETIIPDVIKSNSEHVGQKLQPIMIPATYAIQKNRQTCSAEVGHVASIRLGLSGSRQVVAAHIPTVLDFVKRSNSTVSEELSVKVAYTWLKNATAESLSAYKASVGSGPQIHHCTLGPLDGYVIPPAWMFYEKIGSKDFIGIRKSFVVSSKVHMEAVENFHRLLQSIGKTNEVLEAASSTLALAT